MARLQETPLEVDSTVTESRPRFGTREAHGAEQVVGTVHRPHALAATAGDRLHNKGKPDLGRRRNQVRVGHVLAKDLRARNYWNARPDGCSARLGLAAHHLDRFG